VREVQSLEYKSPVAAGSTGGANSLSSPPGTAPCLRGCPSTSLPRPSRSRTNHSRGSGVRCRSRVRKPGENGLVQTPPIGASTSCRRASGGALTLTGRLDAS
ncbi:hypothetical protein U0070_013623, partial [Myodes glareolus]